MTLKTPPRLFERGRNSRGIKFKSVSRSTPVKLIGAGLGLVGLAVGLSAFNSVNS